MPAKTSSKPSQKKVYTYDYRKISFHVTPAQYDNIAAYCGVTKVKGKILKVGQMARHLTLEKAPKGAEILQKLKKAS